MVLSPPTSVFSALLATLVVVSTSTAKAATVSGWNTANVEVAPTPPGEETGLSVVYDRELPDATAVSNGRIAFTPPEAVSPGIKVQPETYTQGGPSGITLAGCLMTSNPSATCTSEFQSGKRIKQQVTGTGPMDLVFDTSSDPEGDSTFQVFGRLINVTGERLTGLETRLGTGLGAGYRTADPIEGLEISSEFRAQPSGSGPVTSQFPFGLFGDAASNPNFALDGFFASERTGFQMILGDNQISTAGYYGPYKDLFGDWISQETVPGGGFWDNDSDAGTEALLMAWLRPDGQWEARRDVVDLAAGIAATLADPIVSDSFVGIAEALGLSGLLFQEPIEDLANLNLNYAVSLSDAFSGEALTLRTQVAPVPLPATAPLLLAAVGLVLLRKRQSTTA